MDNIYQIDNLDRDILRINGECENTLRWIGQKFEVSPGTIHVRVEKMKHMELLQELELILVKSNSVLMSAALLALFLRAQRLSHRIR